MKKEINWYFTSNLAGIVSLLKLPHGCELVVTDFTFNKESLNVITTFVEKSPNISVGSKVIEKRDRVVCNAIWDLNDDVVIGVEEDLEEVDTCEAISPDKVTLKHGDKILCAIFTENEYLSCFKLASIKIKIVPEIVEDVSAYKADEE